MSLSRLHRNPPVPSRNPKGEYESLERALRRKLKSEYAALGEGDDEPKIRVHSVRLYLPTFSQKPEKRVCSVKVGSLPETRKASMTQGGPRTRVDRSRARSRWPVYSRVDLKVLIGGPDSSVTLPFLPETWKASMNRWNEHFAENWKTNMQKWFIMHIKIKMPTAD